LAFLLLVFSGVLFQMKPDLGSASIAHSVARVKEPVSEGFCCTAEPFIDTVVICTMTALVILFTGLHQNPEGLQGAQLTSAAFATVISLVSHTFWTGNFAFCFFNHDFLVILWIEGI
jgi:alanine or glycine:cation symporter, AGCS family